MKRRAFTFVELLTSIGIILILVGIMLPVLKSAKHRAKISVSLQNLHQFHLALKMYQTDYDGEGKFGTPAEMGFPPAEYITLNRFGTPLSMWASPCGQNFRWFDRPIRIQYGFFPHTVDDKHAAIAAKEFQENLITFFDMNCTDDYEALDNPLIPHRGLGVLLSGQLLNLKRTGLYKQASWWANPTKD